VVDFNLAFFSSSEIVTVKRLLKSVHIYQSYCKKNLAQFFWPTLYTWPKRHEQTFKCHIPLNSFFSFVRIPRRPNTEFRSIYQTVPPLGCRVYGQY